jgi:hypothetical protein
MVGEANRWVTNLPNGCPSLLNLQVKNMTLKNHGQGMTLKPIFCYI